MFCVQANKYGKILFCFTGVICVVHVVAMAVCYKDFAEAYSDSSMKIVILAIYIVLMMILVVGAYGVFDSIVMRLVAEKNGFRIKHLFRKEVVVPAEQVTKWKIFTQFLRNGATSENIIIYYNNGKSKIEITIREYSNFEKLLNHLITNYKYKRV